MICADTSVWIEALRGSQPALCLEMDDLLAAGQIGLPVVVKLELLIGASAKLQERLRFNLLALPQILPTGSTWSRIETWISTASGRGRRFSIPDLLIAALAAESDAPVWSLDRAFEDMAMLGWISIYRQK